MYTLPKFDLEKATITQNKHQTYTDVQAGMEKEAIEKKDWNKQACATIDV